MSPYLASENVEGGRPREDATAARDALYAAGHFFVALERFVDAAPFFRMLLVIAPHDERGWLGLGRCHEYFDQHEIAREIYSAGAQLSTHAVRLLLACARLERSAMDFDRIGEILNAAESAASTDEERELVALERREILQ